MAECRTIFVIVMSAFPSLLSSQSSVCVCLGFGGEKGRGGRLNNGKESKERTIQFWIVADEG